jgi:thiamine-monophosphate kinase
VTICSTVLGRVAAGGAVLRSGARAGDAVCVTGALGGSSLGRHLDVRPRQDEALALVQGGAVHAMIDLSDGLSSDLGHVLDASEVGAVLWADAIPVHADAERAAELDGRSALLHALDDGEDFELLFCVPQSRVEALVRDGLAGTPVHQVGIVTESHGLGLAADRRTAARPLARGGYDHFRSA